MSLARVYTTKGPVRKDGLVCGKCRQPIVKGQDRRRTFAVGFRGYEQTRCMRPECTPTRAELESSAVATVYAAIDDVNLDALESAEDFESARDEVVAACEEVADEYESNEMYEVNYDLQERAETVRSAGDELSNWSPEDDEPQEEDWDEDESEYDSFEEEHTAWLEATRDSFESALDDMDLP